LSITEEAGWELPASYRVFLTVRSTIYPYSLPTNDIDDLASLRNQHTAAEEMRTLMGPHSRFDLGDKGVYLPSAGVAVGVADRATLSAAAAVGVG
jgi:hypothetical protein